MYIYNMHVRTVNFATSTNAAMGLYSIITMRMACTARTYVVAYLDSVQSHPSLLKAQDTLHHVYNCREAESSYQDERGEDNVGC